MRTNTKETKRACIDTKLTNHVGCRNRHLHHVISASDIPGHVSLRWVAARKIAAARARRGIPIAGYASLLLVRLDSTAPTTLRTQRDVKSAFAVKKLVVRGVPITIRL